MNREMFWQKYLILFKQQQKKITKSKSFTQENEKNDPAKGKKIPFATTTYYN